MESRKFKQLVNGLLKSYDEHKEIVSLDTDNCLNRSVIIEQIENLRCLLFPGFFGKKKIGRDALDYYAGDLLEDTHYHLSGQLAGALWHCAICDHARRTCAHFTDSEGRIDEDKLREVADELCYIYLSKLPEIRALLATDVDAIFDGDPAAFDRNEIVSSYPGLYAIMVYRLAHALYDMEIPLIPRIMTEHAHSRTGIDIHPGAKIGHHFMIDHGTGVVIGQTTVIGNYVKIYQGVTLGGLSTRGGQFLRDVKRHPTIEDNVTIYASASILGGETVIGANSVIGSNAFITKSVPPNTKISGHGKNI
jgi:serine O-acetyltransferase